MPPNFPGLGTLLAIYIDVNDLNALHTPKGSQAGAGCTLYQGLPSEIALPQTGGPPRLAAAEVLRRRQPAAQM